ncbi:MAG TPA: hypothetical protein VLI04_22550 [Nocardioidaceae bacterium]|nr:hypothetical protein [Nocardioidaceae bacterium]
MSELRRAALLVGGCVVLGLGVAMLLLAALGSDGYSTLVNGIRLTTGIPFLAANVLVSIAFVLMAWTRGLRPGIGTVVQIVLVGLTVSLLLEWWEEPSSLAVRVALLIGALPVLSLGIAAYLGSQSGAGPAEAAALAWDPPVPFRWSYSAVQIIGATVGWLLGAAIGPGTAVSFLLGPTVDLAARFLRVDTAQPRVRSSVNSELQS